MVFHNLAPELIGDNGSCRQSTKPSEAYSFGILSFEVYFCCEAWPPNVSMQLLDAVRHGHRPTFPIDAPNSVVNIIKECWLHDWTSRPNASAVSQLMQELLSSATNTNDVMTDTNDDIGSIEIGQCILDTNSDNMITFTGEINSDHVHCGINTTSANNLAGNDAVIYSNARGGVVLQVIYLPVEHQLLNFMLPVIIQPAVHYPVKNVLPYYLHV